MCSKRCAKPVRPGSSLAGPTWYQRLTATIGSARRGSGSRRARSAACTSRTGCAGCLHRRTMRQRRVSSRHELVSPADATMRTTRRTNEDLVQHDVSIRQPVQPRPFLLVLTGGVSRLAHRYQQATDRYGRHGSPIPSAVPARQLAEPIRSLHGLDDAEVADRQHVGPVQPEHQEHLRRPATDALDARQRRDDLVVGSESSVSRSSEPSRIRAHRSRTYSSFWGLRPTARSCSSAAPATAAGVGLPSKIAENRPAIVGAPSWTTAAR